MLPGEDRLELQLTKMPKSAVIMQTKPVAPTIAGPVAKGATIGDEARNSLVELNPAGLFLNSDGSIGGDLGALPPIAHEGSFMLVPTLRNAGEDGVTRSDLVDNLLVDEGARQRHIAAIVGLVVQNMYAGIDLDYRGINPALRNDYSLFAAELAQALHENQKTAQRPRQPAVAGGSGPLGDRRVRLGSPGRVRRRAEDPGHDGAAGVCRPAARWRRCSTGRWAPPTVTRSSCCSPRAASSRSTTR